MDSRWYALLIVTGWYADLVTCFMNDKMIYGPAKFGTDTPQMILFTYTGNVTDKTRKAISAIFPEKFTNKNGCPIGITIFVVSEDTVPCSAHKLYVRGHEIALSGSNYTNRVDNWGVQEWNDSIASQRQQLANASNIRPLDISGMRAQRFFPGDNSQFAMLNKNHFEYDSSLLLEPSAVRLSGAHFIWPFPMTQDFLARISCRGRCPNDTFAGLWQVPVNQLFDVHQPELTCAYLDECLGHCKSSDDVQELLMEHLNQVLADHRAPLHINLRPRTLDSPIAQEGIRKFIERASELPETWFVTTQQLVAWLKAPTRNSFLLPKQFWDCHQRTYVKCFEENRNVTIHFKNFSRVMDINKMVLWQTIILVICYIAAFSYDRTHEAEDEPSHLASRGPVVAF